MAVPQVSLERCACIFRWKCQLSLKRCACISRWKCHLVPVCMPNVSARPVSLMALVSLHVRMPWTKWGSTTLRHGIISVIDPGKHLVSREKIAFNLHKSTVGFALKGSMVLRSFVWSTKGAHIFALHVVAIQKVGRCN